jgi:hypothetical protein
MYQQPIDCRWKIPNFIWSRSSYQREITLYIYRLAQKILNLNTHVKCRCEESDENGLAQYDANEKANEYLQEQIITYGKKLK